MQPSVNGIPAQGLRHNLRTSCSVCPLHPEKYPPPAPAGQGVREVTVVHACLPCAKHCAECEAWNGSLKPHSEDIRGGTIYYAPYSAAVETEAWGDETDTGWLLGHKGSWDSNTCSPRSFLCPCSLRATALMWNQEQFLGRSLDVGEQKGVGHKQYLGRRGWN